MWINLRWRQFNKNDNGFGWIERIFIFSFFIIKINRVVDFLSSRKIQNICSTRVLKDFLTHLSGEMCKRDIFSPEVKLVRWNVLEMMLWMKQSSMKMFVLFG
jgi:hypothetical protein